jgi:hypothetical protein
MNAWMLADRFERVLSKGAFSHEESLLDLFVIDHVARL